MTIEYLAFQTATLSDGTNTYSATSIGYDDGAEVIKIKNTRTSGKTQVLAGYRDATAFSVEFDYDDSQTLPASAANLTITGTLKMGKTFVITGIADKIGIKGSNGENWKGSLSLQGDMTTAL